MKHKDKEQQKAFSMNEEGEKRMDIQMRAFMEGKFWVAYEIVEYMQSVCEDWRCIPLDDYKKLRKIFSKWKNNFRKNDHN